MRLAIAAVPVVLALAVCIGQHLPPAGDEPHYLLVADSVASDRDLNLQNNYELDSVTRRMFRYLVPHVYNVPRGGCRRTCPAWVSFWPSRLPSDASLAHAWP
jgi:hypothetical protein